MTDPPLDYGRGSGPGRRLPRWVLVAAFVATAVVTAVVVHVVYSFGDFYSGNRSRPPIRVIPTTMPTTATAPATVSAPGAGSR